VGADAGGRGISERDALAIAIAERDRILINLDADGAKAFIRLHGGTVPRGKISWLRVLHLARFEARSLPAEVQRESHIWLARNGAQSVMTLPPDDPYLLATMDLLFPRRITEAVIKEMEREL